MSLRGRAPFHFAILLVLGCGSAGDDASGASVRSSSGVTADIVAPRGETQADYYQRQVLLINKWIRDAGPPPRSSAGILEIVRQSRDEGGKFTEMAPYDLVTTLETWLKSAQGKDSVRQAAAYLVADRVLRLAWHPFGFTDPSQQAQARTRLKTLGASSELSAASNEMAYAGGWLQQAAHLDPKGPMGQRAAMLQLEADCAGGDSPQSYYAIVQRLEPLVAAPADSEVNWTAQILEADAYRDIVALATGLGKENADSAKFVPEVESAKTRAIALYQAALAGDTASRLAKGGQSALARLTGGLAPNHVRFFCFGQ